MGPVYLRGHYGEGRVLTLGDPFRDWEIGQDRMGGLVAQRTVLCWFAVSRNERDQYKKSWPLHYTLQPEMCICRCMQWLGAEAWSSMDGLRERTEFGCMRRAWGGWSVVWATASDALRTEPGSAMKTLLLADAQKENHMHSRCKLWEDTYLFVLPTSGGWDKIWDNLHMPVWKQGWNLRHVLVDVQSLDLHANSKCVRSASARCLDRLLVLLWLGWVQG